MNSPTSKDQAVSVVDESDAQLLAVEFDSIPFVVKRVFVVSGRGGSRTRGNHVAGCSQKIVLLSGKVDIHVKNSGNELNDIYLRDIGSSALVAPDDYVTYELLGDDAQILVLASESYEKSQRYRDTKKY